MEKTTELLKEKVVAGLSAQALGRFLQGEIWDWDFKIICALASHEYLQALTLLQYKFT